MIRVLSAIFNTRTYIIQGHQYLISIIHLRECYFVLSDFSSPIRLFLGRPFHSFFSIINTQYSIIFKFYKKQAKVRENKIIAFFKKKRILQFERLNPKRQYYIISYNLTWFFSFSFQLRDMNLVKLFFFATNFFSQKTAQEHVYKIGSNMFTCVRVTSILF